MIVSIEYASVVFSTEELESGQPPEAVVVLSEGKTTLRIGLDEFVQAMDAVSKELFDAQAQLPPEYESVPAEAEEPEPARRLVARSS